MRIFGLMPIKDEAHRYLYSAVANSLEYLDDLLVYDDASTDYSVDVALNAGATVVERPAGAPSFLEHEGRFRQVAYDAMEEAFRPELGDWILAIDADESLVSTHPSEGDVRKQVEHNIIAGSFQGVQALLLEIPEFFGVDADGTPLRRVDGEWGRIAGTRLFAWQPGGVYADRPMACGAEPTYVPKARRVAGVNLALTHWGYVSDADKKVKYQRYSAHTGHSNKHVESIPAAPTLVRWSYRYPEMHRGDELDVDRAA